MQTGELSDCSLETSFAVDYSASPVVGIQLKSGKGNGLDLDGCHVEKSQVP